MRDEQSGDEGRAPQKRVSAFQLWFEEAWEGWIQPVGLMVLCAIGYLLYKFDLVSESVAGGLLVLLIIGGTIAATALPAWGLARTPALRALFTTLLVVWPVATLYPSLRAAMPGRPLAEGRLTAATPSVKLQLGAPGPHEVTVSGRFKQAGMADAEATYTLSVTGGGGQDEITGALKRQLVSVRTSRRGGSSRSMQEKTEHTHRLEHARGSELTFASADPIDEQLDDGLQLTVRPAGLNPTIFLVLGVLALLMAIALDSQLIDAKRKIKTYLTTGAGVTAVFAWHYPGEATPHSVVRPAVGALFLALLVGGIGGWLLGAIARGMFGPKVKRARR